MGRDMLTELANMRVPVHDFINQLAVTKLQLTVLVIAAGEIVKIVKWIGKDRKVTNG